jgi:hypothetical protein
MKKIGIDFGGQTKSECWGIKIRTLGAFHDSFIPLLCMSNFVKPIRIYANSHFSKCHWIEVGWGESFGHTHLNQSSSSTKYKGIQFSAPDYLVSFPPTTPPTHILPFIEAQRSFWVLYWNEWFNRGNST